MYKRTPLYDQHVASNAKFIAFHSWEMPINYGSQIEEHHAVRNDMGVFDVSHMTIVDLLGAGGRQVLRYLLTNDVDKIAHPGQGLYSCMLNQQGGVIDDLIVYECAPDNYRLVLNSATRERTLEWIKQQANATSIGIFERSELAIIAIQGPNAIQKVMQWVTPTQMDAISTLHRFECADIQGTFVARTGYTGEDGLEVIAPADQIVAWWELLMSHGAQPCGLGARDTLRLEAGLLLSGQDMDETTTPLESGLGFTVAWEPQDRDFIGRDVLQQQKKAGVSRKLVGLELKEPGVMRPQQKVIIPDVGEGIITSGTFSPTLGKSIALARVPVAASDQCYVEVRGKALRADIVKPRFLLKK